MDIGIKTVFNLFVFFFGMLLLTVLFSLFIMKHHATYVLNEVIEEIEINNSYDNSISNIIDDYVNGQGFSVFIREIRINNDSSKYNVSIIIKKKFPILNYEKEIELHKTTRILYK